MSAAAGERDEIDRPLRDDVRRLGALLGEVLREQGPDNLYERVEAVRLAARQRRQGDADAEAALSALLAGGDPDAALPLVRAFSAYFFVVNMAERIHRIRRALDYQRSDRVQPGSWADVVDRLAGASVDAAAMRGLLDRLALTPVFTAHPTEATRRSLLVKEQRIARLLVDGLNADSDEAMLIAQLRNELTTMWQTEEQLATRPAVADEVEHIVFYLSDVIYRVVPRFERNLRAALQRRYGEDFEIPPLLHFGSWVGGDMDGNPNVGPDTIRATLARQQELVLKRYRDEVRELFGYLTQSTTLVAVAPTVTQRIDGYRKAMPQVFDEIAERYHGMPYRVLLWFIARRLDFTAEGAAHAYANGAELLADLHAINDSLSAHRGEHAGAFLVRQLMARVRCFGFYMATLDVRQHAGVHRAAVGELLGAADFAQQAPAARSQALEQALQQGLAPAGEVSAETRRCLNVIRAVADSRARYGDAAIGLLIISMAQGADDALAVMALAQAARGSADEAPAQLDITPLFETVDDLSGARATLQTLWANPTYRKHLRACGNCQYVMLGYSDSGKDSGIASARWALYRAQTEIIAAAREAQIEVTLFHGRGGSISRGGGRPRQAILAEPPGAVDGRLRVTEQGEIIHAKYGLRGAAIRTLELMGGAVLERLGPAGEAPPPEGGAAIVETVAKASRRAYRGLVYERADFIDYFRTATPIDVIERLQIGSRPVSRGAKRGIEDLRAIPWVFSWTQSRHLLPGWFGVGSGLAAAEAQHGLDALQALTGWRFFDNLLSDAEMALAKADLDIAARYSSLAGEAGQVVFNTITEEYSRTRDAILRIRRADALLATQPVLRRALRLRNPYVDPMSVLQVDLLQRWRQTGREDPALERALIATVHGIARGMQNTG